MTSTDRRGVSPEFPFASLLRSSDRERILVQLMTSVWETILQLPILPREGHDGDEVRSGAPGSSPRSARPSCTDGSPRR
jgi:hypothetical protein